MTTKIHYNHRLGIMSDHSRRLSRLLSLPPAVRQLIFEHLIPVGEASFPVKSLARPHDYSIKESDRTCYALLLTCRMLYKEVVPIVYSTKHFIDQYRRSHLQRLQRLMPTALHSLKKLTILLNVSTCEPGWFCCKERFGHTQSGCAQHDELLGSTPPHQAIIAEWYRTIDHIAPHIQDSSLSLYFICDVVDIDTAIAAVKPLLDQSLPTLAECNIRLSPDIDPQIQQLACQAAEKAMGHSQQDLLPSSKAFPFLALPVELRYQILQHTDIIAPYRQVDWNPRDGYYLITVWQAVTGSVIQMTIMAVNSGNAPSTQKVMDVFVPGTIQHFQHIVTAGSLQHPFFLSARLCMKKHRMCFSHRISS